MELRTRDICNFSQCRCSPCDGKGRPKLTGYACLALDDRRRSQELTHRDRCGFDKMELRVEQSPYKGAALAGTIDIGDLTVNRLGFGAMRLCGDSAWGRPRDQGHANRG